MINRKSEFSHAFRRTVVHRKTSANIKNQSEDIRKQWSNLRYNRTWNLNFRRGFARLSSIVGNLLASNMKVTAIERIDPIDIQQTWNLNFRMGFAGLSSITGNLLTSKIKVTTTESIGRIWWIINMKSEFSYAFCRTVVHRRKSANIKNPSEDNRKFRPNMSYDEHET